MWVLSFAKNVAITNAGNQLVAKLGEVYTEQSGKAFEDFLRAAVIALNACDGYARFESEQVGVWGARSARQRSCVQCQQRVCGC